MNYDRPCNIPQRKCNNQIVVPKINCQHAVSHFKMKLSRGLLTLTLGIVGAVIVFGVLSHPSRELKAPNKEGASGHSNVVQTNQAKGPVEQPRFQSVPSSAMPSDPPMVRLIKAQCLQADEDGMIARVSNTKTQSAGVTNPRSVRDYNYATELLPQLLNVRTPSTEMAAVYQDLMTRPEALKLPGLLLVAEQEGHPYAAEALEGLRSEFGVDYGTEWDRWQQTIVDRVQRNGRGKRASSCLAH